MKIKEVCSKIAMNSTSVTISKLTGHFFGYLKFFMSSISDWNKEYFEKIFL